MAETILLEGHTKHALKLWLFTEVKNCSDLVTQVQSHSLEPECSLINASLVADLWLVKLAAFKALADQEHGRLKTHSLHGELVFNLSGSKHIGESFKRFGVAEDSTNLLVGRFDATPEQEKAICHCIDGKLEPLENLHKYKDLNLIQQALKCSAAEQSLLDLTGSIATRIAVRDC